MIVLSQIRAGSVIMVRGGFGNDPPVRAQVLETYTNIKNNTPGVDYVSIHGDNRWAYLDQVQSVITY